MAGMYGGGSQGGAAMAQTKTSGGGGGGGMSFGVIGAVQAIGSAITEIYAGKVAKAQADYNRVIIDGQIKWIDFQKEITARQYERSKGRFISSFTASVAGAGLMPSGSPMAALLDSVTQINIDKAISMANIEQQKNYKIAEGQMQTAAGKAAKGAATVNAFSEILNGASNYAMYTKGINLSQGATKAGKQ